MQRFISIEGVDGAGKSSHLEFIAHVLRDHGHDVVLTREPGGTPVGEKIRAILLSDAMTAHTETLLMFAARNEHVEHVILPALKSGKTVLSDRFLDSSRAYQGGGKGVDPMYLWNLETLTCPVRPALTFVFDVSPAVARARMQGREMDRFESESAAFHERVREVFLALAADEPGRVRIIDANRPMPAIRVDLARHLTQFCADVAEIPAVSGRTAQRKLAFV